MFGELENLSAEDKQFMIMMENGAEYVNSHYRLPLPLRNPALIVPNNRAIVEKRANYLKKRFMKNQEFFEDSQVKPYDKTWCIPHHDVYYPSKLGKIRVVLDCLIAVPSLMADQSVKNF